ncbi:hypothetical protein [Mesorhizobium koreense]|uniref:hypothetical protein n=1 Tax=Mesorhizobium koreense TaxID=3074855 RepID=UPI00287B723C|nr:hypothetical protein [Mesorhizobium sp. WR6]
MELLQRWLVVAGLIVGFYGVLLLTKEWGFIFGRKFRSFVSMAKQFQIWSARRTRKRFQTASNRRSSPRLHWIRWLYDVQIFFIRINSRNLERSMLRTAHKFHEEAETLSGADGIIDPARVEKLYIDMHEYIDDLVENGEAIDRTPVGLLWVMVGQVLQIAGSLPLS